jgi:hypothetical protein
MEAEAAEGSSNCQIGQMNRHRIRKCGGIRTYSSDEFRLQDLEDDANSRKRTATQRRGHTSAPDFRLWSLAVQHIAKTRAEAHALGLDTYYPDAACGAGHPGERRTTTSHCLECNKAAGRKWRAENQQKNIDDSRDRGRLHRLTNPGSHRSSVQRWDEAHPGHQTARMAKRHARRLNTAVGWGDDEKITAIYAEAARLRQTTNVCHQVDSLRSPSCDKDGSSSGWRHRERGHFIQP